MAQDGFPAVLCCGGARKGDSMTRADAFLTQWSALKEEMVKTIRFQINQGGIRFNDLNHTFQTKVKRWSSRMSEEGRLMESVENAQCRQEVLKALSVLTLQEAVAEKGSGLTMGKVSIGGAVAGAVIGAVISQHIVGGAAGAACGAVISAGAMGHRESNFRKQREDEAARNYVKQIDMCGEKIAEIWRRYENG